MTKWANGGYIGGALVALAWPLYYAVEGADHQIANIGWLALTAVGGLVFSIWVLRKYVNSWLKRVMVVMTVVACCGLLSQQLEFRGFSGELVPQFRWRSLALHHQPSAFASPEPLATANVAAAAWNQELKSLRFEQFMGNRRDGTVDGPEIQTDWQQHKPQVIWEIPVGAAWSGFSVAQGLAVTQEQFENKDAVSAFDLATGKLVWRSLTDRQHYNPAGGAGPRATPTIFGDQVICQSSTGIVTSMELRTGKIQWSVDLLEKAGIDQASAEQAVTWGRSGSPLVIENLVVVPLGAGANRRIATDAASLIAMDVETGQERWRAGESQISYSSPSLISLGGKDQIVIVNEADVTGHEILDGKVLWKTSWPGASNGGPTVSQATRLDNRHLLLSKGYGGGSKVIQFLSPFDPNADITTLWSDTSIMKTKFMSPVILGEYAYGLSDGILECIRWADGKRIWKDGRQGRLGHGQLLLVGEQLVCSSEDGRLVITTASPSKPTIYESVSLLNGITWNPLAIAGNLILTRNGEQAVCVKVTRQ